MSIHYHQQHWLNELHCAAIRSRHRFGIWLSGSPAWRAQWRAEFSAAFSCARVLRLDTRPPRGFQPRRLLGQEFDLIWLQGARPPAPELLAILAGTLVGGGLLLCDLDPSPDPAAESAWSGAFDQWLLRQLSGGGDMLCLCEGQPLPRVPAALPAAPLQADGLGCYGAEQRQLVEAVLQVVHGHRRRPLVVTAERGRGKSAALGIAAARLLAEGRQRVLVTAPNRAAVETLFERAGALLPDAERQRNRLCWQQGEVRFMPPDQLLQQRPNADLLLVDEAAAISAPLLSALLARYARIVFATTTHGYEGTGRGFELRFRTELERRTPGWRALTLQQPIRWAAQDPLERWLYRTLLLDAEAAAFAAPDQAAPAVVRSLAGAPVERWSGAELLAEPALLRQLFALLVLAHYQTSPNDLRELLQGEGMAVWLIRHQGQVAAAMLTLAEGGLAESLSTAVWLGQRRPPGHLLPQTLIAQSGWLAAGGLRYQRIVRITVHPALQRQGLGQRLLAALAASPEGADLLGSSFAASDHLPRFWQRAGYQPLRLGLTRDAASGSHSLLVARALNPRAAKLLTAVAERFWSQLRQQLASVYHEVEPTLLAELARQAPPLASLGEQDALDLVAYALGGRGFEQSQPVLAGLVWRGLGQTAWPDAAAELLVRRVLQGHEVSRCCEHSGLSGRRALETELRRLLLPLVRQLALAELPAALQSRIGALLEG